VFSTSEGAAKPRGSLWSCHPSRQSPRRCGVTLKCRKFPFNRRLFPLGNIWLDARRQPVVLLKYDLSQTPNGAEFYMLTLTALVGLLSVLLVATVATAYVAFPSGRMCTRCGGPTDPLRPGFLLRLASRWLHRRWCPRCGWEGVNRNGPDVAPFELPVEHDSGFRWRRPDGSEVPVFTWRPEGSTARTDRPSGFRWVAGDTPEERPGEPSDFQWRPVSRATSSFRWKEN
jgi:hypothetical protein